MITRLTLSFKRACFYTYLIFANTSFFVWHRWDYMMKVSKPFYVNKTIWGIKQFRQTWVAMYKMCLCIINIKHDIIKHRWLLFIFLRIFIWVCGDTSQQVPTTLQVPRPTRHPHWQYRHVCVAVAKFPKHFSPRHSMFRADPMHVWNLRYRLELLVMIIKMDASIIAKHHSVSADAYAPSYLPIGDQ